MKTVFLFSIALVVIVGQGCIKPVTMIKKEPPPAEATDTTTTEAEPFDPVSLGEDVFQKKLELGKEEQPQQVFGYRVQIGAFGEESSARALKAREEERFGDSVHLIYEEPFWCVRLGDFEAIDEAETAKKEAIARGYTDARIVEDKIIVRE